MGIKSQHMMKGQRILQVCTVITLSLAVGKLGGIRIATGNRFIDKAEQDD